MTPLAPLLLAAVGASPPPAPEVPAREAVPFSAALGSSTSTPAVARVLLAPTWGPPVGEGRAPPSEAARAGFSRHLVRAARRRFEARGLEVLSPEDADAALTRAGSGALCRNAPCFTRAARAAGASHWLASLLLEEPGRCAARVVLFDVASERVARRIDDDAAPCTAENLLGLGRSLGARVAQGPPRSRPADLALTPRAVPELSVPDLPDLRATRASTSTRAERSLDYGLALGIYEARHLIFFEQDGEHFLAQQGRLLTECEAWRVAWMAHNAPLEATRPEIAPLPRKLEAHCRGNHWEWAWLGVPTGAVIAWGSWGDLSRGELGGVAGFSLGLLSAAIGAGLALSLDEDGVDPERPEYLGSTTEIEAMVRTANAALRRRLELSDADVLMAGMRL